MDTVGVIAFYRNKAGQCVCELRNPWDPTDVLLATGPHLDFALENLISRVTTARLAAERKDR